MGSWRPVDFEFGLASNLVDRGLISELSDELVGLNIDILFAWGSLWCLDIACEELLSRLSSLLFEALGVVLALISLEELVRVGPCGDNHGCIGATSEHTLIIHDVLREVLLLRSVPIRVLILLLLRNDARVRSEALASRTTGLLHHFLNFYLIFFNNNSFLK